MKKIFYLLVFSTVLYACQEDKQRISYDLCTPEYTILDTARVEQNVLVGNQIPVDIRAYIATELPGYRILGVTAFKTKNGNSFTEVELNRIGFLIFDSQDNYLCVVEDYPRIIIPPDTTMIDTTIIDTTIVNNDTLILLTETDTCATGIISFERDILPLVVSGCGYEGCHDVLTAEDNVILVDYETIRDEVRPGNTGSSKLYETITKANMNSDKFMPPLPAISFNQEQIQLIADWINQGANETDCRLPCNSENISFSEDIFPLIQNQCIGCHQPTNDLGNISLADYDEVKISVDKGEFLGSIKHLDNYEPMPETALKMTDCQIAQIENWIKEGAQNN